MGKYFLPCRHHSELVETKPCFLAPRVKDCSVGSQGQVCPSSRGSRAVDREPPHPQDHLQGAVTALRTRVGTVFVAALGHLPPGLSVSLLSHTCTRRILHQRWFLSRNLQVTLSWVLLPTLTLSMSPASIPLLSYMRWHV